MGHLCDTWFLTWKGMRPQVSYLSIEGAGSSGGSVGGPSAAQAGDLRALLGSIFKAIPESENSSSSTGWR